MIETRPPLSEQVRALVAAEADKPPFWERDVAAWRRDHRDACLAAGGAAEPVASVEEIRAGSVPVRIYRPAGDEAHVLVWLHGGAWVVGDLETEDVLARSLANRAQCAVITVDYRRAPEYRYPAALHDAWAVTEWATERFDAVAIGGDSAGGNLSAVVALQCRDRGLRLALQLLVYPMLDHRVDSASYDAYREGYREFAGVEQFGARCQESIGRVWDMYVPNPDRRADPSVSPFRATTMAGLAPALIITAEHDILRGEAEDYARRLQAAGVPTAVLNYEGQVHDFYRRLGVMEDARDAVNRSASVLRQAFLR